MHASSHKSSRTAARLTGFAASALWHRRLTRSRSGSVKVHPRVSAELVLHPVVRHGSPVENVRLSPRYSLDARHAA